MGWADTPPGRFERFPYREENRVREGGSLISVFRPTLDINVALGDLNWTARALVDSGAPSTLFDRGMGEALDVDYEKVPRRMTSHQLAGDEYAAQVETVTMTLDAFPDLTWEAEVSFLVEDWGMPFQGLLGTRGFLDRWVVTFHVAENSFYVEEPDSFASRIPPDVAAEFERRDTGFRGP